MSKLYFNYGTVSSSKTLNLLAVAHNYIEKGTNCIIIKPALDTRSNLIESRAGLSQQADIIIKEEESLFDYENLFNNKDIDAVLVDEVQFLTEKQINELRLLSVGLLFKSTTKEISVLCYGLRTKSDGTLWPSIITLMAVADEITEIKTVCRYCNRRAVFSKAVTELKNKDVNVSWDAFIPVCPKHFFC